MIRLLASMLLFFGLCLPSWAHPLAPALLQLHETVPTQYDVIWRTSATRVRSVDVAPALPADCHETSVVKVTAAENESLTARWTVQCDGGLIGKTLRISGLEHGSINVILRINPLKGEAIKALLGPEQTTYTVAAPGQNHSIFLSYLQLGIEHLLTGFDHLLFVLGLLLLVPSLRLLVWTVTAFTLGHSITLTLATLNLVQVPQALAEWAIAMTILVLACELARGDNGQQSWIRQRPWGMAAVFGLIHGLGFAGALREVGLPQTDIPLSLLAFNFGIEIGQLGLILAAILIAVTARRVVRDSIAAVESSLRIASTYLIGTLAAYWCFDRLSGLFA